MKKKSQELREKSPLELLRMIQEKRDELGKLYFNLASGRVKNVKEAASIRRDIARIQTLLKEKKDSS